MKTTKKAEPRQTKMPTKTFFFRLSADWEKKISEIAERECRSKASVVRQAVWEFIKEEFK